MNITFPEWSPGILVELYNIRMEHPIPIMTPEEHIDLMSKRRPDEPELSEDRLEKIKRNFYRDSETLPEKHGTELLHKLLTDLRMKQAWISLSKRIQDSRQYMTFWHTCQRGISGWQADPKHSRKKRQETFLKIVKHVEALKELMDETTEFHNYGITESMDEKAIKWLIHALERDPFYVFWHHPKELMQIPEYAGLSEEQTSHISLLHSCLFPSVSMVLSNIEIKSLSHLGESPVVLKPGTDNAAIIYFIRIISSYFLKEFEQPLHETVATTTSVIFNKEVDSDYVRKIVS